MVNGKNIVSRRRIQRALEVIESPFTTRDMATASKMGIRRVGGLLKCMEDVRREAMDRSSGVRVMWHYEPEEPPQ